MRKVSTGRFFEDFGVGQAILHAIPRTLHGGDIAAYMALTGERHPLASSTELARSLGFQREVIPDLLVFHIVFGKSVPDISHNATANLGYADVRFLRPVYPGDTLVAESEVIGLREASNGEQGVVYVRTRGLNQKGQEVLTFLRWVMVPKRDKTVPTGAHSVPQVPPVVSADRLPVPDALNLQRFPDLAWAFGSTARWDDYEEGERLDHTDAMTIEEADHVQATRLYHNTAQVHFDAQSAEHSRFGKRIVYGGHVISVALALARNGLDTQLRIAAWNGGSHVGPTFAGDTLRAFTEVVERAELPGRSDVGALRLRMSVAKNLSAAELANVRPLLSGTKEPRLVLELDYWALFPRR
ncbi:MAG: MaoC family dehydratase [Deltaproteobacteria bacterium]|nr:MaoC family dehydratase [Deltaproteobacteria bacterium]MCW5804991.1 MaoC family dehydratase [Deltaproteobacteria bacterium]